MREFGVYETKKFGRWGSSEYTEQGWIVDWSAWVKEDSDFEEIGDPLPCVVISFIEMKKDKDHKEEIEMLNILRGVHKT